LISFGPTAVESDQHLSVLTLEADHPALAGFGAITGSAYLIRPDLHIAARWHKPPSAAAVQDAITRITARQEPTP
jgi:3-(3-hydroxy-phenyl)propionate hydroxylase